MAGKKKKRRRVYPNAGKRYLGDERREALRLYREGNPISRIVQMEGMPADPKTLRRWLREASIRIRVNERQFPRKEILKALRTKTRTQVQEKYGCSAKFLSNLVNGKIAS